MTVLQKQGLNLWGHFMKLETSSPAAEIQPGDSLVHVQSTFHVSGSDDLLDQITNRIFQVSLQEITSAF